MRRETAPTHLDPDGPPSSIESKLVEPGASLASHCLVDFPGWATLASGYDSPSPTFTFSGVSSIPDAFAASNSSVEKS